jgi:hypothetical protein
VFLNLLVDRGRNLRNNVQHPGKGIKLKAELRSKLRLQRLQPLQPLLQFLKTCARPKALVGIGLASGNRKPLQGSRAFIFLRFFAASDCSIFHC